MSLRVRLTLTFAGIVALVVAGLGAVLYVTMRTTLAAEMDRRLLVRADQVQLALWPGPDSPSVADLAPGNVSLAPLAQLDAPAISVQVLDLSGRLLASSENLEAALPLDQPSFQRAVRGQPGFADFTTPSGRLTRVVSVPIRAEAQPVAVLRVVQSREVLREAMDGLRRLLLSLGGLAVVLAGATGWLVAYRGLNPLSTISAQAAEIAAERDFGRRLSLKGVHRDEVGRLAGVVDELLDKVEDTLRAHREFLAETSHELRNPLLAIRTNLDLLSRVRDQQAREECISEAIEQVTRMSRLVSDLLLLAQVESRLVLERRAVDLQQVIERATREARVRAAGQGVAAECPAGLSVLGDELRIAQILGNLLDNAIKHTPAGGRITVRGEREGDWARLEVADTGEGIAADALPHIFERSFSLDGSGHGLGLAIVKHLAEAHGGRVAARSELGRGATISVWLPAA